VGSESTTPMFELAIAVYAIEDLTATVTRKDVE
jgi:hypothetical protein